jgi:hypothetical protein
MYIYWIYTWVTYIIQCPIVEHPIGALYKAKGLYKEEPPPHSKSIIPHPLFLGRGVFRNVGKSWVVVVQ